MTVFTTVRVLAMSAAALATLGGVSAASAEPSAAAAATASSSAGSDYSAPAPEMKYCVSTTVTGSRIPQRSCKTKADWAAEGVVVELKKARG